MIDIESQSWTHADEESMARIKAAAYEVMFDCVFPATSHAGSGAGGKLTGLGMSVSKQHEMRNIVSLLSTIEIFYVSLTHLMRNPLTGSR